VQIDSIKDLINEIDLTVGSKMYRGQSNSEWSLIPSIARMHEALDDHGFGFSKWEDLEDYLLNHFKNYSAPFMDFNPSLDLEWLVHAQHHGLPTPLLDWSTNPLKALFFAVENPSEDKTDGALYEIQPRMWHITYESIENHHGLVAFHPKQINSRVMAQEGCFTRFPYPDKLVPLPSLEEKDTFISNEIYTIKKYFIPKEIKANLRVELTKLGIHHQSMFPSLDGASTRIRREFNLA
tara:strand:+ start:526 stop:1236 length:711 start_codon:yes stop_codon:yes gene_type:complete